MTLPPPPPPAAPAIAPTATSPSLSGGDDDDVEDVVFDAAVVIVLDLAALWMDDELKRKITTCSYVLACRYLHSFADGTNVVTGDINNDAR